MAETNDEFVAAYFQRSLVSLERALSDAAMQAAIVAIADRIEWSFRAGGRLLIAGSGTSAADAQKIAAEFVSRAGLDNAPLPALALTSDGAVLNAIADGAGFEHVYERQVRAFGRRVDILLVFSVSGRSPPILAALQAARQIGLMRIGFTGLNRGAVDELCDYCVQAPVDEASLVQQIHLNAALAVCGLVERALSGK